MIEKAIQEFPNFKATATTLREVHTATVNDWAAICWHDGEFYESNPYPNLEIMDRVGGGDSFASGLVYGFLERQRSGRKRSNTAPLTELSP
jgi:2-dehydro-3-deoxygluconokinase